jgi:hypothetical protein
MPFSYFSELYHNKKTLVFTLLYCVFGLLPINGHGTCKTSTEIRVNLTKSKRGGVTKGAAQGNRSVPPMMSRKI